MTTACNLARHPDTRTHIHNRFTALFDSVRDYEVSWHQKGKTNLDLLEHKTVSGRGISWAICKSARWPRHITTPDRNFKFRLRPASCYCVFQSRTPNINVPADYFLPIMLEYSLIASKQYGCWQRPTLYFYWRSSKLTISPCEHEWTPKMQHTLCYICPQTSQIAQTTQNKCTPINDTIVATKSHL